MSLMKLLSVSTSFVNSRNLAGRYKLAEQGMLPKFAAVGRPISLASTKGTERQPDADRVPARSSLDSETGNVIPLLAPDPSARSGPPRATTGAKAVSEAVEPAPEPTAVSVKADRTLKNWFRLRRDPFTTRPSTSVRPRQPEQPELLLEAVTPVRNDLSDADLEVVPAPARLAEFAGRFELRRGNVADLADWIEAGSCEGVLLDLGVSSPQLDQAERGFSFQHDGPLDMRMDRRQALTAANLVNDAGADELLEIFRDLGEEPEARRLARAIESERRFRRFETTRQLAELVERIAPRRGRRLHPATRVFQALRMAVNDEVGVLRRGLDAAVRILRPGGRLAVITFHSVEARAVNEFVRERWRDSVAGWGPG